MIPQIARIPSSQIITSLKTVFNDMIVSSQSQVYKSDTHKKQDSSHLHLEEHEDPNPNVTKSRI